MNFFIARKFCTSSFAGFLLFGLCVSTVLADGEPNGNYTYVGSSIYSTTFATPVCLGTECHKGLVGFGLDLAYQIIPNVAISYSVGSAQNKGSLYTLKSNGGGLFIAIIGGIGSSVDVAAIIGSLSSTSEICINSSGVCNSFSDTGSDVGLIGKVWLNEGKNVNIGLSYDNYSYSKSTLKYSTSALSLAFIPAHNHEIDVVVSNTMDSNGKNVSSGLTLGYKYLFDHGQPTSRKSVVETKVVEPIKNTSPIQLAPVETIKPLNSVTTNVSAQKLRDLNVMKNEGLITEIEYQQKKKQLLEQF